LFCYLYTCLNVQYHILTLNRIPATVPSLAISVFDLLEDKLNIKEIANIIESIQRAQKNYFAFILNARDDLEWMELQFLVSSFGSARMIRSFSQEETAHLIVTCLNKLSDIVKLKIQEEYFSTERIKSISSTAAREVISTLLIVHSEGCLLFGMH
jgi:hypothetical protein